MCPLWAVPRFYAKRLTSERRVTWKRFKKKRGELVSYEARLLELQRVKIFSHRNVYGIDLGPVAVSSLRFLFGSIPSAKARMFLGVERNPFAAAS